MSLDKSELIKDKADKVLALQNLVEDSTAATRSDHSSTIVTETINYQVRSVKIIRQDDFWNVDKYTI